MALAIPPEGLSLSEPHQETTSGSGKIAQPKHLLLVTIPSDIRNAIQKSSQNGLPVEFIAGKSPAFRFDGKTHDVSLASERYRHELYRPKYSENDTCSGLALAGLVTHAGKTMELQKVAEAAAGAEAAEEQLKRSLQRLKEEKESKKANITNTVAPVSGRKNKPNKLLNVLKPSLSKSITQSMPNSPSFPGVSSSPMLASSSTLAGSNKTKFNKAQGLKLAVIHLLAIKPTTESAIARRTRSSRDDVSATLLKVAKPTATSSEWQLLDKSYKELDVWSHSYPTEDDRQAAIDHAIRAYDRMRLAQSDPLWDLLLPKSERGKNKVLSRLNRHPKSNINSTPRLGPKITEISNADGSNDSTLPNAGTGNASEPMNRSVSQEGIKKKKISEREAQSKRLLSKNPKKAQALLEAKQKKQQQKEIAAKPDDKASRPVKSIAGNKQTTKQAKSSEYIHDSDEEEADFDKQEAASKRTNAPSNRLPPSRKRSIEEVDKIKQMPSSSKLKASDSGASPQKKRKTEEPTTASKKPSPSSKVTPIVKGRNGLTNNKSRNLNVASSTTSKSKADISPRKSDTRPEVPSPLGAAKPLTASYDPERNRTQASPNGMMARKTAPSPLSRTHVNDSASDRFTPKASSTSKERMNVKAQRTSDGTSSESNRSRTISSASSKTTSTLASDRPIATPSSNTLKRKANDIDKDIHNHDPPRKQPKVETSTSSHNIQRRSNSTATPSSSEPPSATSEEFPVRLTPRQSRRLCEQMRTYFRAYEASRLKLQAIPKAQRDKEEVAAHWKMHNRLLEMKEQIWNADVPREAGEPRNWQEYLASGRGSQQRSDGGSS
ncbi:MAG: hypothetical protein M1820_003155 [Bogoriella megaspora]|nr:MAG: hypothetical protein M1820_003155 [Bogoriella megaspora]